LTSPRNSGKKIVSLVFRPLQFPALGAGSEVQGGARAPTYNPPPSGCPLAPRFVRFLSLPVSPRRLLCPGMPDGCTASAHVSTREARLRALRILKKPVRKPRRLWQNRCGGRLGDTAASLPAGRHKVLSASNPDLRGGLAPFAQDGRRARHPPPAAPGLFPFLPASASAPALPGRIPSVIMDRRSPGPSCKNKSGSRRV